MPEPPSSSLAALLRTSGALPSTDRLPIGMLCLVAVGLTAAKQGAILPPAWGWSALGLLLATALTLALRRHIEVTRLEGLMLGGLACLLAWIALSTLWSVSPPRTVHEVERSIIYVAALGALFALGSPKSIPYVFGGVLAAAVDVSGVALVTHVTGPAESRPLSGSLLYWNALGILAAIGLILALGFALTQLPRAARIAAAASVPLLATTLYLTHSRGAFAALGVGLFAFGALHPRLDGRPRRIVAVGVLVLVLAALTAGIARAGGPGAFLDRTYEAFRAPPAPHGQPTEKLLTFSGNFRADYWRVAWNQYREHPWLGSGSGTFDLFWNRDRETIYYSRDAHNLYLETLAELGAAGLLLLVGTLSVPLLALRRAPSSALLAAAAGAYVAFLAHAGVDWDWEMPTVTLAGLFCGGGLLLAASGGGRSLAGASRGVPLAAVGILAAFTLVAYRGNSAVQAGRESADRGGYKQSAASARTAMRWTPWSSEAWLLRGESEAGAGDEGAARSSFRAGIEKDPREWRLWYGLALTSQGAEREQAIAEAARLNQYSREVRALQGK